MLQVAGVQGACAGPYDIGGDLFHDGVDTGEEVVGGGVLPVEVQLEVLVGYLVALFVPAVVWQILLDCVVGEVDAGLSVC
jgi:hypothetical protein